MINMKENCYEDRKYNVLFCIPFSDNKAVQVAAAQLKQSDYLCPLYIIFEHAGLQN
jgi:hypothetical protein